MAKFIVLFLSCLTVISCQKKNVAQKVEVPVMYEASEMAILMRGMYEFNNVVKAQIINKESLTPFPEVFEDIHSAVLTDKFERNNEFDSLSKQFINYQNALYSSGSDSTVYFFNKSINTCITCHEPRCTGPIPKMKKLLIY